MNSLHQNTQQVLDSLTGKGVALPSVQQSITVQPDYSRIPDTGEGNIGDLIGRVTAYIQYLESQVGIAEIESDSWQNTYEYERKRIMLTLPNERRDIMEAKADEQLQNLKLNAFQKQSIFKLLKTLLEGSRRVADSLSRELSRRSLVLQMQRSGLG
jgi:hypothetical protein